MMSLAVPCMCTILPSGPVPSIDQQHDLGGVAADEHMPHISLQRQAELDIVLEYGRELGAISDGSPVVRENAASGAYKAIIASIFPELNRLSRDGITASASVGRGKLSDIRGLLFVLVELPCGDDAH